MNKPLLGPQNEPLIEERTVGKPILSELAGMVFRSFRRKPNTTVADILAMTPDEYARAVWSVGGHALKTKLFDAGIKDAQAPGGRLSPPRPKEK